MKSRPPKKIPKATLTLKTISVYRAVCFLVGHDTLESSIFTSFRNAINFDIFVF